MTTRREEFDVGDRPTFDIESKAGTVTVRTSASRRAVVTVDSSDADGWRITQVGDSISVEPPGSRSWTTRAARVHVDVPEGADVELRSASSDVTLCGSFGSARVRTASGDVDVDDVQRLDVNCASGDVRVAGAIEADASCTTASGTVEVSSVGGRLTVSTASGDVRVGRACDDVQIGSATGDVRIERYDGSNINVKTISGEVTVGLPSGIRVEPDLSTLSGRTTVPGPAAGNGSAAGDPTSRRTVRVRLKTISGDITILRV